MDEDLSFRAYLRAVRSALRSAVSNNLLLSVWTTMGLAVGGLLIGRYSGALGLITIFGLEPFLGGYFLWRDYKEMDC